MLPIILFLELEEILFYKSPQTLLGYYGNEECFLSERRIVILNYNYGN